MTAVQEAMSYIQNLPQGFREDILYFLQDLDESNLTLLENSEYRYYTEYPPDTDDLFVQHLEKVLTLLCPSIYFREKWGSYFEIKLYLRWQEGAMRIPLAIKNIQQERIIQRTKNLKQELVAKALRPERVAVWLDHGDKTLDMMMGIY